MTVPKVLAVTLLLAAIAVAAQWVYLVSTGPYGYRVNTTGHKYLLWFPPHAVPMNLTLLNVTWTKPEAIWFIGKYPVRICKPNWCGYELATIYVVQDGVHVRKDVKTASYRIVAGFVEWHIKNRFCAQGIAMVAPNKVIELSPTTQIWISDVYCLYGNKWFWLRLLPYVLEKELVAEGVELVNFTDTRVSVDIPSSYPWPRIPAAWYLDSATWKVFRIPDDIVAMEELQRLRTRVPKLEAELANKTAKLAQLNATIVPLSMTVAQLSSIIAQLNAALAEAREEAAQLLAENQRLKAQLEALNRTRVQLEAEAYAYKSQLEAIRASVAAQLAQLTAENQALKAQIASMNETLAELQPQIETWTRAAWIGAALGAAAGAAATALALRRRK